MTKAGKKLIAAAKEAVQVARCEHELSLVSQTATTGGTTTVTECRVCRARFTEHRPVQGQS